MDSSYYDFVPITYRDDLMDGYMINKMGQMKTPEGMILKGSKNSGGYLHYSPRTKNGGRVGIPAHIAVANQFLPNPNHMSQINHLDENKMNPCIDNLEWTNQKINTNYGSCQSKRIEHRKVPINEYDKHTGKYIRTWKSSDDFGKYCTDYNVSLGRSSNFRSIARNITNSCTNKKTAYGKLFRYYDGTLCDIDISDITNILKDTHNIFNPDGEIPKEYLYQRHSIESLVSYFKNYDRFTSYDLMLFNELINQLSA